MATPTQTPQDNDQDRLHNPGAQNAENLFEKHGVLSQEEVDARRNQSGGNSQQQLASNESAPSDKQAMGDSAAGKTAVGAASVAASPIAGAAVKLIGKIKTKKGGIGSAVIGVIIATIILIFGFAGPGLLIVQVKEALTEKFNDVSTAISERNTLIVKKKISNATAGCGAVKVKCRFKGMSDRQIQRIERTGVKVNTSGGKNAFGRTSISNLTMPDGTVVTGSNYRQVMRENPLARGYMNRAFNSKYTAYSSKAFDALSRKIGIDKRKKLSGGAPADIKESMKNGINGVDRNGDRIGRLNITEQDGKFYDANGNELKNANGTSYTAAQADAVRSANAEFDRARNEVAVSGKKAAFKVAKSAAITSLTAGLGTVDSLCTGYYLIQIVGYGAKIISAQQLIRFAYVFMNTADVIKAGDAKPAEVEYLGKLMTKTDTYGESFTDSFGYKYAALDSLALPVGATPDETDQRRGSIMQYALGGGLGGALLGFNQLLNRYTENKPKEVCKVVKNPFSQIGLLVGGVLLTVVTAGGSLSVGTAVAAGVSVAVSAVIAIAIPTLQNIAADKLVTEDTVSADAGNAAVAGVGALNAQNGQAHALAPLTKDQVLAYQQKGTETSRLDKIAERSISNPLDVSNPASPAYSMAVSLQNYIPKNVESVISSPASVITASARSLFSSSVDAQVDPMAQYNMCQDVDYTNKNYAADPFCNIRYGLTKEALDMDPETVVDWMLARGHIDNDGKPSSGEYTQYLNNCVNRVLPIGSTGPDGQDNEGADCNKPGDFEYFRVYYLDTIINDDIDDEDTFGLDQPAVAVPATPSPTSGSGPLQGQYSNGKIPASALCILGPSWPGQMLRCDAKDAFLRLNAAYSLAFGKSISVTSSYRSFEDQVRVKNEKGSLAATPGKSNHGWGQALDLGGGINNFGTAQYIWMKANAPASGWIQPSWAEQNGSNPEAWHWEFGV